MKKLKGRWPLTSSQYHLWLGQQKHMESSLYNMAYAHSIDGLINPGRFQSAWANLTNSAPVLKTTVKVQNGVAVQCFDAQIDDLKIIDLSRSNDSVEESKSCLLYTSPSPRDRG